MDFRGWIPPEAWLLFALIFLIVAWLGYQATSFAWEHIAISLH
jgi:hypothetical protein